MKPKMAAALAAAAFLAGACSTGEKDESIPQDDVPSPTTPAISRCRPPARVNTTDPDAVADAAAAVMACHDTRSDASPLDAIRRARPWLDPSLVPDPGAQTRTDNAWAEWAKTKAWTPATVERIDLQQTPDYTSDTVSLARQTHATPTSLGQRRIYPGVTTQWILTLTRRGTTWIVTSIEQDQ